MGGHGCWMYPPQAQTLPRGRAIAMNGFAAGKHAALGLGKRAG
jgi:hypothetical protein